MPKFENNCYGCEVCASVCANEAIRMVPDNCGFYYPQIDSAKCIKCGKCEKACPMEGLYIKRNIMLSEAFEVHKTDREKSASCGFLKYMEHWFIRQCGIVFCAVYENEYRSVRFENLKEMRGCAEYIQAKKGEVYKKIKEHLDKKKKVLFVGLPCEAAALKSYLCGEEYENLYIADKVCRGIIPETAAEQYIDIMEKRFRSKLSEFDIIFREDIYVRLRFESGKIYEKPFYATMLGKAQKNLCRRSCVDCQLKAESVADITVGEGCDGNNPVLMVHTVKGRKLIYDLPDFSLRRIDIAEAAAANRFFMYPCKTEVLNERFTETYAKSGLCRACLENLIKKII